MAWRNQATHQEETKAVKTELVRLGYKDAKVRHGSGTAWGWLHIKVSITKPVNCGCERVDIGLCRPCLDLSGLHYRKAIDIAQTITGRHGEYDGNINATINLV